LTALGKIIVAERGTTLHERRFLIIDTGGDDTYLNSAGGAKDWLDDPFPSLLISSATISSSEAEFSQGSGVFGIGILAGWAAIAPFSKKISQGVLLRCGLLMKGRGSNL